MEHLRSLSRAPMHHFFGYYGICAYDREMRHHLALRTRFHDRRPGCEDSAEVGLLDVSDGSFTCYGRTAAFNLQQGAMLHWINTLHGEEFTYNDWEDGRLVSRALSPDTGKRRTLQGAIAAVSPTQPVAMALDFGRMFHCRPVTGYASRHISADIDLAPEEDGLYQVDLQSGAARLVLSVAQVMRAHRTELTGPAWFNHVAFSPDGQRVLFLFRVRSGSSWRTSLWTVNPDGTELQLLVDDRYWISHYDWRDSGTMLVSTDLAGRRQFVLIEDRTGRYEPFAPEFMPSDGHACYSPERRWVVTDTYPIEGRSQLRLYDTTRGKGYQLGAFDSPAPFVGDIRCDLHPRWRPDGLAISFDSIHEGSRQVYELDLRPWVQGRS